MSKEKSKPAILERLTALETTMTGVVEAHNRLMGLYTNFINNQPMLADERFKKGNAVQIRIADALERIAEEHCKQEEDTTGTVTLPIAKRPPLEGWSCKKCAYQLLNGKPCRECSGGSNFEQKLK